MKYKVGDVVNVAFFDQDKDTPSPYDYVGPGKVVYINEGLPFPYCVSITDEELSIENFSDTFDLGSEKIRFLLEEEINFQDS